MWTNETVTCTYVMNFNINTKIAKNIKKKPRFSNKKYMEALTFVCNLKAEKKEKTPKSEIYKWAGFPQICPIPY